MAENTDSIIVRSKNRLLSILGIKNEVVKTLKPLSELDTVLSIYSGTFSNTELKQLPTSDTLNSTAVKDIQALLNEIGDKNASKVIEARSYKLLTPEISKARSILIPTIMSPNDIQTDHVSVIVDIPELDDDVNEELSSFLSEYFNDDLKLGIKVTDWIGDALFETGATPVLILPKRNIEILSTLEEANVSTESLSYEVLNDTDSSDYLDIVDECTVQLEGLVPISDCDVSLESFIKNGVKEVNTMLSNSSNKLLFTSNCNIIKAPEDVTKKLSKKMKQLHDNLYGDDGSKLFILSDDETLTDGAHPSLIQLSTECVVPVTVPGSKTTHIGYFVLVDKWGNPVIPSDDSDNECLTPSVKQGVEIIYNLKSGPSNTDESKKFEIASIIFSVAVKKVLEAKLEEKGLEGVELQTHQAMSAILFKQLLQRQCVNVVFVPAEYMAYYAFDYRDNGTGKSLLEDSAFLLSLRNNLMIANVMAAIKNSTDYKRIEFEVGEDTTNVEQLMALIEKLYINKRMLRFDHNPMAAVRDMIQRSITIIPKGLPGMGNLSVTSESNQANSVQPDRDMMEMLTNLIVTGLDVPHSVLNQLGENEFSRSIATTNLFFSNTVRARQRIVVDITTKLIQRYIKSSSSLMNRIEDILKPTDKDAKKPAKVVKKGRKKKDKDVAHTEDDTSRSTDDTTKLLSKIVNHVYVSLPSPAISVDKAHYEELRSQIELIEQLVNAIYDPEIIPVDKRELKDTVSALRVMVKQILIKEAMTRMGAQGSIEVPDIDDLIDDDFSNVVQRVMNITKSVITMTNALEPSEDGESGGGRGW